MSVYANPYVGPIIKLSPSGTENWHECHRLYLNKKLLGVPASDADTGVFVGLDTHRVLEELHSHSRCSDDDHLEALLHETPGEHASAIKHHVERHRLQCPAGPSTDWGCHEHTAVRASLRTTPRWVVSAKLDAVWAHDGILDVRDYKTGRPIEHDLSDDIATRLQAFVIAPVAEKHSLRLRLSHENLAPGAPGDRDWWEPEAEDLESIRGDLNRLAAEIAAEVSFDGVADSYFCSSCSYRSICPDTAESKSA
jgi:hypothetical protein